MKRLATLSALVAVFAFAAAAQTPFTFADMMQVKRVAGPQLSPDNGHIAFIVGTVDMAGNRVVNQIYTVRPDGTDLKQLTNGDRSKYA
jgi:hypothetical protein